MRWLCYGSRNIWKGENKLKTEILSQEKNVVEAKAQFTAEEVNKAIENTYKDISKKANIKGFRKGKVPRRMLELYFPKDAACAETLEKLLGDAIDNMVEEFELKLIADPDLKPEPLKENEPYEFTVKFEVSPEVTLPELAEIEAEKTIYEVTDAMVDERVAGILDSRAEIVPTYEERPLTKDDYASVKYDTYVTYEDGEEKKEQDGMKTEVFLGSDTIRPEVAEALIGKNPGEKASIELPNEGEEAKKAKAVKSRYEIEVLGIMKKNTPELTDELAAEITHNAHKTVDEFKASIRKQLETSAERQSESSLKDSAVEKAVELSEVEIPEKMIERQKDAMREQQAERIKRENDMTMEDFFAKSGMDKDSYEAELDSAARKIVKRSLVLEAIADENDINWTPDELKQEINSLALMSGVEPQKLQEYIYGDRNRLYDIAERLRARKTIDFIAKAVKSVDVPEKKDAPAEKEAE